MSINRKHKSVAAIIITSVAMCASLMAWMAPSVRAAGFPVTVRACEQWIDITIWDSDFYAPSVSFSMDGQSGETGVVSTAGTARTGYTRQYHARLEAQAPAGMAGLVTVHGQSGAQEVGFVVEGGCLLPGSASSGEEQPPNAGQNKPIAGVIPLINQRAESVHNSIAEVGDISGTVTLDDGITPASGMGAWVYGPDTCYSMRGMTTDTRGQFHFANIPAGIYKLDFTDTSRDWYVSEWHDNKASCEQADPISVTSGMTVSVFGKVTLSAFIAGVVTAEDSGLPLANVSVNAEYGIGMSRSSTTDVSGTYRIAGFPAGVYRLRAGYNQYSDYVSEYFDNTYSYLDAATISATAGATTTINFQLARGSHVTGRIIDAGTGQGLAGVSVSLQGRSQNATASASAMADVNGYYTTTAVASGVYQFGFLASGYFQEWFDHTASQDYFTPVTVSAPLTRSGVNSALTKGLIITGIVTGNGVPIGGVSVKAYRPGDSYKVALGQTSSGGIYQLTQLMPGAYRIRFEGSASSPFGAQWYSNSASFETATLINLVTNTTNINADLISGGTITGIVTGSDGQPIVGARATIYRAGQEYSGLPYATDTAGVYSTTAGNPGAGLYHVYIAAPEGWRSQWYKDGQTRLGATLITVTNGVTTGNVNVQLQPLGATGVITGWVTAADTGLPIDTVVNASAVSGETSRQSKSIDGRYTITGLVPGSYRVSISPGSPYVSSHYGGTSWSNAARIIVTAGATISNINMVALRESVITGVVSAGNVRLAGVRVEAKSCADVYPACDSVYTYSGVDGSYLIRLSDQSHVRILFTPEPPFVAEWYDNVSLASGYGMAVNIPFTPGIIITGVDADLATGGMVSGLVTAADTGKPLSGVRIIVSHGLGGEVYATDSDMDGDYHTPGLPTGAYTLTFDALQLGYVRKVTTTVIAGQTSALRRVDASLLTVNVALEKGGSLSGFVGDGRTGAPLAGYVAVYGPDGTYMTYNYANEWGYYQVGGLATGEYTLRASELGYWTRWYDQMVGLSSADIVTVTQPNNTPEIDFYLFPPMPVYLPLVRR